MASSLFGNLPNRTPQNNMLQMIKNFNQFKQSLNGQDAKSIVCNMLSSGKMSQAQFEQMSAMANELSNVLK